VSIWFGAADNYPDLAKLDQFRRHSLAEHLDIRITQIGEDFLAGTMPVDARTHQPLGVLHGGASVALAETLGSLAANLCVDPTRFSCVGQEINANHIRAVRSGLVTGIARPIHLGRRSHVWEIRIDSNQGELVCISRLTMFVLEQVLRR
jgi:1,4-dihydroxy-2-naphthoyl-CoA hydrolase